MTSRPARLRELMRGETPVVAPLVLDPMAAKLAEAAGFTAGYLGGGALGYLSAATEANLSLTQIAQVGLQIGAASELPLIMDGTCGWGDPMHLRNTIGMAEAAGFAAIEIEDQLLPKRAHHHIGTEHLIPAELMAQKIEEAVAAKRDPDFLVIARTNGCRTDNVDEALRRAERYRQAGADMLLILQARPEEAVEIGERIEGPLMYMALAGVGSIGMTIDELGQYGYRLVVDAMTPFLAQQRALRESYEALSRGAVDPTVDADYETEIDAVHRAIGLEDLLEVERRTVER